jgi:hypothetical protein
MATTLKELLGKAVKKSAVSAIEATKQAADIVAEETGKAVE